jgi:hypothetical protein
LKGITMYFMTVFVLLMTAGSPVPLKELHNPEPFATEALCKQYFHTPEGASRLKHISTLAGQEFNGRELAIGFSCEPKDGGDKSEHPQGDDGKI